MAGSITVDQWKVHSNRNNEYVGRIEDIIYTIKDKMENGVNNIYSMNPEQFHKTYKLVEE